jgi:hypothetical protein
MTSDNKIRILGESNSELGYLKPKFIKKKNLEPKPKTEKPCLEKAGTMKPSNLIVNGSRGRKYTQQTETQGNLSDFVSG